MVNTVTEGRLREGLAWAMSKDGSAYGWADILNQGLEALGKDAVLLDKSYDCSHLACNFLWIAGVLLPAWMIDEDRVTPGDLYRMAQDLSILYDTKANHV
jgi:hypothetical protein